LAICLTLALRSLHGQSLPILTGLGGITVSGCSGVPVAASPQTAPSATSAELRSLIARAQDASLVGDHVAARDAYARATEIAPFEPRLTYYLGREHEALRDGRAAVQAYCRYLTLDPEADDADDVRGRVVRLTPKNEIARTEEAQALFRSGVVLLQRGDYGAADSLFSRTLQILPTASAAMYNRGLARAVRGERDSAVADFRRYVAATPDGADHAAIASALDALPRRLYDPARTLVTGAVLPGLGQFTTQRPIVGGITVGAFAGAMLLALRRTNDYHVTTSRDVNGTLQADSLLTSAHPTAMPGYAAAATVWLSAAIEGFLYARRTHMRASSIISRGSVVTPRMIVEPLSNAKTGVGLRLLWR
jgi:tetratricopeptide (TPR) repeat protein